MIITKCRVCGSDVLNKFRSTIRQTCSPECVRLDQIKRQTGKKRPTHSAHMKQLAAGGENVTYSRTLMKKGELHNKDVNTIEFMKKCMDGSKFEYDPADIASSYSVYQGIKVNSIAAKRTKVENAINRYADHELVGLLKVAARWNDAELDTKFYSHVHGIFTALNFEKRGGHKIPVECSKGIIDVRSSYEKRWIEFFDNHGIQWEYEPNWFRLKSGRCYLPDFLVLYNGRRIWVEVKGAFWGHQKEDDYMQFVVKPFKEIIAHDGVYLLTFNSSPTIETFEEELKYATNNTSD